MAESEKPPTMNPATMTIRINQWRCRAFHGLYAGEPILGGEFEVNVEVTYRIINKINEISDTISYVDVLNLLREEMKKPRPLLEALAMDMAGNIKQRFPGVVECRISIDKLQAPIDAFQGKVGVSLHQKFTN